MNGKNLRRRLLMAGLVLLASAGAARAAAPATLTYQGRLKEGGFPVSALRNIDIQLCDAPAPGGTCVDTGVQSVPVTNGLFRVVFPVPAGVNLETGTWYVEVRVAGNVFLPREQLSANPYAVYSSSASTLIAAPGVANVAISTPVAISGQDSSGYSLVLSSGISTPNGTVAAKYFVGNGSGLTGIATVDGTKVLRSGDSMSGTLNMVSAGINLTGSPGTVTSASSVTASAFFGDGSHLTGITASGAVLKSGDTMTGQLTNTSTVTVLGSGFSVGGSTFVVKGGQVGIGTNNFSTGALLQINTQNDGNLNRISLQGPVNSVVQGIEFLEPARAWNIAQNLGNFGDGRLQIYDATAGRYSALFGANGDVSLGGSDAQANPGLVILNAGGVTASSATFAVGVRASTGDFRNGVSVIGTPTYGYFSSGPLFDFYGNGDSHVGGKLSVGAGASGKLNVLGTGTAASVFVSTDTSGNSPNLVVANGGGVGLGTASPAARLHVSSGTLLVDGGSDDGAPTGAGTRLFFLPSSGALRAGQVTGSQFDLPNIGAQSVAFGYNPTASGPWSFVGGGQFNVASGARSVVAGGDSNTASNNSGAVGGGASNNAGGQGATIPGGYNNVATGDYSFAGGHGAAVTHTGSFVWASGPTYGMFDSKANEEVAFRANGGVRFVTGTSTFSISSVGDVTAASSITASAFFGDGSHLSGVAAASAASAVSKTGDTMTGQLTISGSSLTVSGAGGASSPMIVSTSNSAGVAGVYVDFNNRVGVGFTAPGAKLEVGASNDFDGLRVNGPSTVGTGKTTLSIGGLGSVGIDRPGTPFGRLIMTENGNLGVGVVSPDANSVIDASGSIYQRPSNTTDTNGYMKTNASNLQNSSNLNPGILVSDPLGHTLGMDMGFNAATSRYRTRLFTSSTGNEDISFASAVSFPSFQSDFSDLMTIRGDSGYVGIGTPAPAAKLHMSTGTLLIDGDPTGQPLGPVIYLTRTAGAGGGGTISFGGTNRGLLGVDNNGEVVLGSLSPTAMTFHTNSTSNGIVMDNERMRIDSNGKVGIGVNGAAPAAMLEVVGDARFGTGAARSAFNNVGSLTIANNSGLNLTGPTGDITTQSSITASAFFGDASHLLNGPPDNTRVLKAGDTMSGNLNINPGALNITNGAIVSQGSVDNLAAIAGPGTRFMWIPSSAAVRAGLVGNTEWNTIGPRSVAFGYNNQASAEAATIAGGAGNALSAPYGFIGGGSQNNIPFSGTGYSVIGGGFNNIMTAGGNYAVIGGGQNNNATASWATVPGGYNNQAKGGYSFAAGYQAIANYTGDFVWNDEYGSLSSNAPDQFMLKAAGGFEAISSSFSFMSYANSPLLTVDASSAVFSVPLYGNGAGLTNVVAPGAVAKTGDTMNGNLAIVGSTLTVGGPIISSGTGGGLLASGPGTRFMWVPSQAALRAGSVSAAEWDSINLAPYSVAFGQNVTASGGQSSVTGGLLNNVSRPYATIAGGYNNNIFSSGDYGFIGAGYQNIVTGNYGAIPGGINNRVDGTASFAGGSQAWAHSQGQFVWNDSGGAALDSYLRDQFLVRAMGGFEVISSSFVFANAVSTLMYVGATGVGIGTTTPSGGLTVNALAVPAVGETIAKFAVSDATTGENLLLSNYNSSDGQFSPKFLGNTTALSGFQLEMNGLANDPTNGDSIVLNATNNGANMLFRRLLDVRNNGTSKFSISPYGYVGIGTNNPLLNLSVGKSSATIGAEDSTTGVGSTVTLRAGSAASGDGGPIFLTAGGAGGAAGNGGGVAISGGIGAPTSGNGGSIVLKAGNSVTAGGGGAVILAPGAGPASGSVVIDGTTANGAHLKSVQASAASAGVPSNCGSGAGVPSASMTGNSTDMAGRISIAVGTAGTPTTCDTVVTFTKAYSNGSPLKVFLSPMDAGGAKAQAFGAAAAPPSGSFTISFSSPPALGTTATFSYLIIE